MSKSLWNLRANLHRFHRLVLWLWRLNWIKTIWINFALLPLNQAVKFPIWVYGPLRLGSLKGQLQFEVPLQSGLIGIGQHYESRRRHAGIAQFTLLGKYIVKGRNFFGIDTEVYIGPQATLTMGNYARLNSNGRLFCYESIYIGHYVACGFESVVTDSNFHALITNDGEKSTVIKPIYIADYNYIGHRVSVMPGTMTAPHTTISSLSLTNKDYRSEGSHLLLGGVPAKVIRRSISRDFEGEKHLLNEWFSPFNK